MIDRFSTSFTLFALLGALAMAHATAGAAQTKAVEHASFEEFADGFFEGVALSNRGRLRRAPLQPRRVELDSAMAFSLALGRKGRVYVGAGDDGRVFRVAGSDDVSTVTKLDEPLVTALLPHDDHGLLVAGAPGGTIYAVRPGRDITTATLFWKTGEDYVWDLVEFDGALFAATGGDGKILRRDDDGTTAVWLETKSKNVMDLLVAQDGRLLAVTERPARVFEIKGEDDARVVYEGKLDEARALAEDSNGNLYVALNSKGAGGAMAQARLARAPSFRNDRSEGADGKQNGQNRPSVPPFVPGAGAPPGAPTIVVQIDKDGFARLLWSAPEAPIHALALHPTGREILVAAGEKGKLYSVETTGDSWIVFRAEESKLVSLLVSGRNVLAGAAGGGALYTLSTERDVEGVYRSPAVDAGAPARWGRMVLEGADLARAKLAVSVRGGATAEPDDELWGEWSKPQNLTDDSVKLDAPVVRYLQYKLIFDADAPPEAQVETARFFFSPPNRAPVIKSINIAPAAEPGKPGAPPNAAAAMMKVARRGSNNALAKLMMQRQGQKNGAQGPTRPEPSRAKPFSATRKKSIQWEVEDPNQDDLESDVYFKADDEQGWKLIEENLSGSKVDFETKSVPDGHYRVRLVARDSPSNPFNAFEEVEWISDRFTIDNTPPTISAAKVEKIGKDRFRVRVTATDALSLIGDARFSADAEHWRLLGSEDRLLDDRSETFVFETSTPSDAGASVFLLITDAEGNTATARVRLN